MFSNDTTTELFGRPMGRRGALGVLGAAGAAWLVGAQPAKAFFFRQTPLNLDLDDLPEEWIKAQGSLLNDYARYLQGLRLSRVTPKQIIASHAKSHGSVWNTLPPKSLWKNISPTLKVLDRLGGELGMPVKEVVSAYRSPSYNARCPGAKTGSYHQANVAVDVRFATPPSSVTKEARDLRSQGVFSGGVGSYPNFTHVDTRGLNVDWSGGSEGGGSSRRSKRRASRSSRKLTRKRRR